MKTNLIDVRSTAADPLPHIGDTLGVFLMYLGGVGVPLGHFGSIFIVILGYWGALGVPMATEPHF